MACCRMRVEKVDAIEGQLWYVRVEYLCILADDVSDQTCKVHFNFMLLSAYFTLSSLTYKI